MASRRQTIWRRGRVVGRRILSRNESAARIARGVAAGFFAATCPVPGVHFGLGLVTAWMVQGNKLASIPPLFLWNPIIMLPLAIAEFKIGAWLWPGTAHGMHRLQALLNGWTWSAPWESLRGIGHLMARDGLSFLGPLALGNLVVGLAAATVSYPLAVIVVWTWRARRRSRRLMHGRQRKLPPLTLPGAHEPPLEPAEAVARYGRASEEFIRAERVQLLVNGSEAFPDMLAAIAGAQRTVDLETYMISADRTGMLFRDALIGAAGRGVHVRFLYDYIGSLGLPDRFVRPMQQAGVSVEVYHPLVLTRPSWAVNRRDHRKHLIVDGRTTFTGGLNITDLYNSPVEGGGGWRDTHLRLDGTEPAERVEELFDYGWQLAAPYSEPKPVAQRLASGVRRRLGRPLGARALRRGVGFPGEVWDRNGVAVSIIGNKEFMHRQAIRRAYLHAMKNARRYILIENAYFIPDRGIRRALAHAVARKVLVAVAIAHTSDVTTAAYAGRSLYSELLASGVRLFEWPVGMLHAKTAVIDDAWSIVGSYNFDHRSLLHQLESVAVVADPAFARRLRDQTIADMLQCHELTLAEHEARPWREMLLESSAYLLRRWL